VLYLKAVLVGIVAAVASLFVTVPILLWFANRTVQARVSSGAMQPHGKCSRVDVSFTI
jgi:hypothetical protein